MIDSLTYWAEEFGVDGFRFDLMGLHDIETMKAIRSAMDDIDPRILLTVKDGTWEQVFRLSKRLRRIMQL